VLATNSYRAAGSGGFAGASPDRVLFSGPDSGRAILLAHIAAHSPLDEPAAPNWRFTPLPGTTALFDSAPAAAAFLPEGLHAEPLDLTPQGFRRFRLHL
jgi:2',3'-cyclic-nucleotide 2'-phosphodiesterase/3'-nucleotidase